MAKTHREITSVNPQETCCTPSDYCGHEQLVVMREARRYNQMIENLLEDHLLGCHSLLDLGAGIGDFGVRMSRHGHAVLGIEPDAHQRHIAASAGLRCMASVEQCAAQSYDGGFSLNVLEHIEDDVGALQRWRRVLKKDGLLFIYVPAFPLLYGPMDRAVGHYRRYTRESLTTVLRAAGFDVLRTAYADSLGFPASLALKSRGGSGDLSVKTVRFYDRFVLPLSLGLDIFLDRWIGKNVWAIAKKGSHDA